MNFYEWLRAEGIECPGKLSLKAARALALPLSDPGTPPMKRIGGIVVHHSATKAGSAAFFRVLHRGVNLWNDIGYHFVIGNGTLTGDGAVETGRALPFTGAHARGGNTDSWVSALWGISTLPTRHHFRWSPLVYFFVN